MTIVLRVDPEHPDPAIVSEAATVIRRGGLVAFPTETVYGLGANAMDADAVNGIFRAKARPHYDPLIVHVAALDQLDTVATRIPEIAWILVERFWPGPLTLVLPKSPSIPYEVTAGGETIAVRMPDHPVAQMLIEQSGVPIAAPSANRFGQVSPTCAQHVLADLEGRIDMILDGGNTPVGVESTVLSLISDIPTILRPGGVSREALAEILDTVNIASQHTPSGAQSVSPGTAKKHYAPKARVIVYQGYRDDVLDAIRSAAQQYLAKGQNVGLLLPEEDLPTFEDLPVFTASLGSLSSMDQIARRLFASLRALDGMNVSVILTRDIGTAGLGLAIRDRLTRAAAGHVVVVTTNAQRLNHSTLTK